MIDPEKRAGEPKPCALILAAGKGTRLLPETSDRPKCLIDLEGKTILRRLFDSLLEAGVDEWVIVTGYLDTLLHETVESWEIPAQITWCDNPNFSETNTLYSVHLAAPQLRGRDFLLLNGDLWLEPAELQRLLDAPAKNAMLVDVDSPLDEEAMKVYLDDEGLVSAIKKSLVIERSVGESIGAYLFDPAEGGRFLDRVATLSQTPVGYSSAYYEDALHELMIEEGWRGALVEATPGCWSEIDDFTDLERARSALRGR